MENEDFTEFLPVKLTEGEIAGLGQKLAELVGSQGLLEEEKKSAASDFKHRSEKMDEEINTLCKAIRTRSDEREVQCFRRVNFESGLVETVRSDTYEVFKSRPITGEDRQLPLTPDGGTESMGRQTAPHDRGEALTSDEIANAQREIAELHLAAEKGR